MYDVVPKGFLSRGLVLIQECSAFYFRSSSQGIRCGQAHASVTTQGAVDCEGTNWLHLRIPCSRMPQVLPKSRLLALAETDIVR